ncbi:MAG TPA: tetratricopeptide repeat protein [Ktedonobacteraceae bacterium]|jgi:tetratricopeptide (TPR) repeat protein
MSKKARRKKQTAQTHYVRLNQPRPGGSKSWQPATHLLTDQVQYVRQQMRIGDFIGAISSGERLLVALPERGSPIGVEVLMMVGLAHGMLKHYQQGYDIFSEAIVFAPDIAELWYNRGLACSYMSRPAEAVRNFERAVELTRDEPGEMARKFVLQLEAGRRELQEIIQTSPTGMTLAQYIEREEWFTQALVLVRQEKWPEAEELFRRLTETGGQVPSYWGNLGVCLMMQSCYAEAEAALKEALALDPDYPVARDNLRKMAEARRARRPLAHKLINLEREEDEKQSLSLYEKNERGDVTFNTVVQRSGHVVTSTWRRFGKQPPLYDFFLNTYQDTRFTTCPRCQIKTRPRKFLLVVLVNPGSTVIVLDKVCRFCAGCGLLIVHQDQLEARLTTRFLQSNPQTIGSDYQVVGTLDRTAWMQEKHTSPFFGQVREYLHDFKEVVAF